MEKEKKEKKDSGGKSRKRSFVLREFSSGGVVYKRILANSPSVNGKQSLANSPSVNGKKVGNKYLWLVTHSSPSNDYPFDTKKLPKGWIDDLTGGKLPGPVSSGERKATEEELQKTAIREVGEEGGVEAKIVSKIGTEKFYFNSKSRKGKVLKFVTFYLMEWVRDLPEGFGFETSEIEWLDYELARKILTYPGEKKILDKAVKLLSLGN